MQTKDDNSNYALLLSYSNDNFEEIKDRKETITFSEDLSNKKCAVWCIDKNTTNPYRVFEKMGSPENLTKEQIDLLKEEGNIKPIKEFVLTKNQIELTFTANSTYLVTIE